MDLIETIIGVVVVVLAIGAAVSVAVAVAYLSHRIAFRNRPYSLHREAPRRGRAAGG